VFYMNLEEAALRGAWALPLVHSDPKGMGLYRPTQ